MGCYEISLGDTIGVGTPGSVRKLLEQAVKAISPKKLAMHWHDTYGQALANVLTGLEVCSIVFMLIFDIFLFALKEKEIGWMFINCKFPTFFFLSQF